MRPAGRLSRRRRSRLQGDRRHAHGETKPRTRPPQAAQHLPPNPSGVGSFPDPGRPPVRLPRSPASAKVPDALKDAGATDAAHRDLSTTAGRKRRTIEQVGGVGPSTREKGVFNDE